MEKHFMEMATSAYKSVRQCDDTMHSFERDTNKSSNKRFYGTEFDPHVRHILPWRLGHENISTAFLPLPLIQEEQLSVTGERMCTKYW